MAHMTLVIMGALGAVLAAAGLIAGVVKLMHKRMRLSSLEGRVLLADIKYHGHIGFTADLYQTWEAVEEKKPVVRGIMFLTTGMKHKEVG